MLCSFTVRAPPAPGFQAPQLAVQGIVFHPPKAVAEAEPQGTAAKIAGTAPEPAGVQEICAPRPDPWAVALAALKIEQQPEGVAPGNGVHTSRNKEDLGEPSRPTFEGVQEAAALLRTHL